MQFNVILAGIICTAILCGITVLTVLIQAHSCHRVFTEVAANQSTRLAGYQRICRSTLRIRKNINLISFLPTIGTIIIGFYLAMIGESFRPPEFSGALLCFFLVPTITLPSILYMLLSTFFIDIPTFTHLMHFNSNTKRIFIVFLNNLLFCKPISAFFLLEGLGLLYLFHLTGLFWLIPLTAGFLSMLDSFLQAKFIGWFTYSIPFEQSSWAALTLHAKEWARAAGIKSQDMYVYYPLRIWQAESFIYGQTHASLLLNALFLEHCDWRQQEAMIACLCGSAQQKIFRLSVYWEAISTTFNWFVITACLSYAFSPTFSMSLVYIILLLCITYFSAKLWIWLITPRYLAADRFAAELTNDPLALLVTLHTIHELEAPGTPFPSFTIRRIKALDQLLQDTRRQPAWHNNPVPSMLPVTIGTSICTVSLQEEEYPATPSNVIALSDYKPSRQSLKDDDVKPIDQEDLDDIQ
jgi:hypothetical protein